MLRLQAVSGRLLPRSRTREIVLHYTSTERHRRLQAVQIIFFSEPENCVRIYRGIVDFDDKLSGDDLMKCVLDDGLDDVVAGQIIVRERNDDGQTWGLISAQVEVVNEPCRRLVDERYEEVAGHVVPQPVRIVDLISDLVGAE